MRILSAADLQVGDRVVAEDRGVVVRGTVRRDSEGGLRVADTPLYVDADGYLLPGVVLLSATR